MINDRNSDGELMQQTDPIQHSDGQSEPEEQFDMTGMVVRTLPENSEAVAQELEALQGVEVHAIGEGGNLVVTIEELDGEKLAVKTIETISNISGVLSTSLIYHHSEDGALSEESKQ